MSWTAATRLPATAGGMRPFTITSVPPTRATPRRWLCWRTASIRGRGIRRSKTEARKLWKKEAAAGEVQAMIALGDDALASDKELAVALQYYRRAQSAAAARRCSLYAPDPASASPRPRPASSPGGKPSPNWLRPSRASGSSWNRRPRTRSSGSTRPRNSSKSWWPRQISPAESGKTQFLYICPTESS